MTAIAVLGGGAFGTALALTFAEGGEDVALWVRDADERQEMRQKRETGRRLPGLPLPANLSLPDDIPDCALALVAIPAQSVRPFLGLNAGRLAGRTLVSCAKGIERGSGLGPVDVIGDALPGTRAGCLTGPRFAEDLAQRLPTALVLAMAGDSADVQAALSRPRLRIYRTDDVAGAQMGGALKNVIALAAGMAIGAGFGDSARAAVIARGFAEMARFAVARGARPETLQGLSGLGDLVLTCTSEKSRNFSAGVRLGRGDALADGTTVEGLATAEAVSRIADATGIEMPLSAAVHAVASGHSDVTSAVETLLARPLRKE